MLLRARQFEYRFPRPVMVMGIVNVTPDSFSDGGQFPDVQSAVDAALRMAGQGAEILDIGGESSRPGSAPVSETEEMRRVLPVIKALAGKLSVPISIDTLKPEVAKAAIAAGASIVNDIAANRTDEAMWRLVAETGAGYVAMHMQGNPQTMQASPHYQDVVAEVAAFFEERFVGLRRCGISDDQVIFDPGIGFGKTLEHNLQLLASLRRFQRIGRPLLLGVSRKSFMGKLLGTEVGERLPAGLACASLATADGIAMIRVHDVPETVQAVRMTEALIARRQS
jgi:dihydropteroate synthase